MGQGQTKNGRTPVTCDIPMDMNALLSGHDVSELESKTIVFDGVEEKDMSGYGYAETFTLANSVERNSELFKQGDRPWRMSC